MSQDTRAETWGVLMYIKVLSDVDKERIEIITFYTYMLVFFLNQLWYDTYFNRYITFLLNLKYFITNY